MKSITINGTGYNVDAVSKLSFAEFKEEGQNSFAQNVTDADLKKIFTELQEANKSETVSEQTEVLPVEIPAVSDADLNANIINEIVDVNSKRPTAKASKAAGAGN